MNPPRAQLLLGFAMVGSLAFAAANSRAAHPLPSWKETAAKQAIVNFVEKVTNEESAEFVPPLARIATFDNDGTLWCEQPMYVQLVFALDRVKTLAPKHPEWYETQPYQGGSRGQSRRAQRRG